jgi:threonine synthase
VLVATSGDTGSAVANGFANVNGIKVKILFPKGKVSQFQEYQMTSLGGNIEALEVDGTFDDCQALVKQAFNDQNLNNQVRLSSANSINVARFLPQMIYYFLAYKQLKKQLAWRKWIVSVPSGNFGNLTAGLIAKKMGLPIHQFVAANNSNTTFYHYLATGKYEPKKSISTFSNAMDVGAPSNFERIEFLYNKDLNAIKSDILGFTLSNKETLEEMKRVYADSKYVLDPHGAVGHAGLLAHLKSNELGLFLETAHPTKFESVVKKALPSYPIKEVDISGCTKIPMGNSYQELIKIILR